MATFWEPPALLSMAVLVGVAGGALYYGLRPALRAPLPAGTSERDEVWGTDDPPPPPKRPYVYPSDRIVVMPAEPPPPPIDVLVDVPDDEPAHAVEPRPESAVSPEPQAAAPTHTSAVEADEEEEPEPSLSDFFRPKRRPPPNATPQD
jgi:hypothetical protein